MEIKGPERLQAGLSDAMWQCRKEWATDAAEVRPGQCLALNGPNQDGAPLNPGHGRPRR